MDGHTILHGSLKVGNTVAILPPVARSLPEMGVDTEGTWVRSKEKHIPVDLI